MLRKKIIIIAIILIVCIVAILIFTGDRIFKKEEQEQEKDILSELIEQNMPWEARIRLFQGNFIVARSKNQIIQSILNLYDPEREEFKLADNLSGSLEATYYGTESLRNLNIKNFNNIEKLSSGEKVLDSVRSYYKEAGYYEEDGKNPLFSTLHALRIDRWYEEDLGQEIDSAWLEGISLKNMDLEKNELNLEHQWVVWEVYRHLPTLEKTKMLEDLSFYYFDYLCNLDFPNEIERSTYLKNKYYQAISLSTIMGDINNVKGLENNCLEKEEIQKTKERLDSINYNELSDIKELYQLYYLRKFYDLRDKDKLLSAFRELEKFYLNDGLKENLKDEKTNLIGTYYGTLFMK